MEPEPQFTDDKEEMQESIESALNELRNVRAYTLTAEELADFKAAHYALRNLHPEFPKDREIPELYQVRMMVEGDSREDKKSYD
jgi:hypothetical protein